MYYEINVALDGKHFFATAERSLTNKYEAEKALKVFIDKFPESEGYTISMTIWEKKGQLIYNKNFVN